MSAGVLSTDHTQSSSDRSTVDFSLRGVLQPKSYRQEIHDVDHLKNVRLDCWVR